MLSTEKRREDKFSYILYKMKINLMKLLPFSIYYLGSLLNLIVAKDNLNTRFIVARLKLLRKTIVTYLNYNFTNKIKILELTIKGRCGATNKE